MSETEQLKRTPLYEKHIELGARIVEFGGWAMPVQYESIIAEHLACRTAAALFDTSHMGQFDLKGPRALEALEFLVTRSLADMAPGQARYGFLCDEDGGTIDDTVVYRHPDDTDKTHYYMVVNAGTKDSDLEHVLAHLPAGVELEDQSSETVKIDIQGPKARLPLAKLTGFDLKSLKRFRAAETKILGQRCLVSRSGYTGEYGFEIYCGVEHGLKVWDALIEIGGDYGLKTAGLGARDTLRLEACLPLYGHELSGGISPVMAGQQWAVSFDKDFLGAEALRKQNKQGTEDSVVPFLLEGRRTARAGDAVEKSGNLLGRVTSGSFLPSLKRAGGMMLVKREADEPGTKVEVVSGKKRLEAVTATKPLYRKKKR